jgi:hypothetical protein
MYSQWQIVKWLSMLYLINEITNCIEVAMITKNGPSSKKKGRFHIPPSGG